MMSKDKIRAERDAWVKRAYESSRERNGLDAWCAGYIAAALTEVLGEEAR